MIVQKQFMATPPGKVVKTFNKEAVYILDGLNEIGRENIIQLAANLYSGTIVNYNVFYEDKGIFTCPECGHDISNTFSFCPQLRQKP